MVTLLVMTLAPPGGTTGGLTDSVKLMSEGKTTRMLSSRLSPPPAPSETEQAAV